MNLFHVIDDAQVILRSRGVYRQAKVYRRDQTLYAGFGPGFITLHKGGGTSRPDVSWLDTDAPYTAEKAGPLTWSGG
jgi:hypothetical protein